ncbi:hypothetical protein [Archangium sp.]|uniref:hypothetical protein n=1 Tax=Archangium sp. TaxID=1872627 RepID=UPI002D718394|nr:hypothetical protein [Archangium sp.]HYO55388.1 hypothetical protein [Archangium sp.]
MSFKNHLKKLVLGRNVAGLKIDPTKVGRAQVFRTWGWRGPIIVSERVNQAMEDEGITGPEFIEV